MLQARQAARVLATFQGLHAAGYKPNVVTHCATISALAGSRQAPLLRTGRRLWAELRLSGLPLDLAAYRIGPLHLQY